MGMNFEGLFRAFDAVVALREATRRFTDKPRDPGTTIAQNPAAAAAAAQGIAGQIENRLTNVVVAALKEAFDRDHARLELERAQLAEERRRAEAALRLEMRRQAADRELARLRWIAGAALFGWIASIVVLVVRLSATSGASRVLMAVGWLFLLAALGAAFDSQRRVAVYAPEADQPIDGGISGAVALWLLVCGLAVATISLLF